MYKANFSQNSENNRKLQKQGNFLGCGEAHKEFSGCQKTMVS